MSEHCSGTIFVWVQLTHPGWLIINASYAIIYVWCDFTIEAERRGNLYQQINQKNVELKQTADRAQSASLAKTEFLSRMSHDIRTPLNGIIGLLEIDEAHPDDKELVDANRKKMRVAVNHLLSLINDVLQMSKLEEGSVVLTHEVIDLVALTQDIVTIIIGRAVDARSVYRSTGMGMTIVKGLIEQMGGTITISSQLGVGSTFTITIPFDIAQKPEAPEKPAQSADDIHGFHLLMAEDNALNADIARTLLKDAGATVAVAEDGRKAVELFQSSPEGTFDAILMDVMMPVMDGLTAARTIRSLHRPDAATIPIIAMTAHAFAEDAEKCLAAGMNAHLAKPLEMPRIKKTICEQVALARKQ